MDVKKGLAFLKKPWVIALAILVIAGGGYLIFKTKSASKSETYRTAQASKGTLTVSVTGTGNVVVDNSAVINPSISGEVYDLSVKVGDKVEEGQTLFKIKNDDLDVNVSKAYVTYLQAKQNIESSKSQLLEAQNNQTEINNDSNSTDAEKEAAGQKVTAAELSITAAEANASSAYNQYQQSQKTASQRTVKATIAGTIITLNITNGDQLGSSGSSSQSSAASSSSSSSSSSSGSSSSAPIVIDDLGSLKASVSINEVDAPNVKADQKVSMTFDAIEGLTSTGKVEQISTVGTNSSGVVTYPATISFDSIDGRIKPQMSITATITTDVKQDVLMVSNSAVKYNSDSTHYVVKMVDGKPVNTTVEVGSSNDSDTEIKSGLSEGDTVVTKTISANSTATATTNKMNSGGGVMIPGMGGGDRPGG